MKYEVKKRSLLSWRLKLLLTLLVLIIPAYYFGPRLYYQFVDDPLLRLRKRTEALNARWSREKNGSPDKLVAFIRDVRKLLVILEKDRPADGDIQYYGGLYYFYDLLLRLRLDETSLVLLSGREILPEAGRLRNVKPRATKILARKSVVGIRKALALGVSERFRANALLILVYGDLLNDSRTDPYLMELLRSIRPNRLSPVLRPYYDWIALFLFSMKGSVKELRALTEELKQPAASRKGGAKRIVLSDATRDLILCYGEFRGRNYLQALQLTRSILKSERLSPLTREEAHRIEGEVFLNQRGLQAALNYYKSVLKDGKGGAFLRERTAALEKQNEKKR